MGGYPTRPLLLLLLLSVLGAAGCIEGKTRSPDGAQDAAAPDQRHDVLVPPVGSWVTVEPGTFLMGPRKDNPCSDATPQRKVTLTRRFQIGAKEVTREQFKQLMYDTHPVINSKCHTCPVGVRWYAAAAYCNKVSEQVGLPECYQCSGDGEQGTLTCALDPGYAAANKKKVYDCPGYRLPTEAEWEFAYRAGSQTDLYNGDITEIKCYRPDALANLIAWYCRIDGDRTKPVGKKLPNRWGLYDMAGNTWEWCDDGYKASLGSDAVDPWIPGPVNKLHAQRGGDYYDVACQVRAVARRAREASAWGGLRCARTLK